MPFPQPFWRLVLIGGLHADTWNTSLALVPNPVNPFPTPPVLELELSQVAAAVQAWWDGGGGTGAESIFTQDVSLTSIKLNRIGTDGRYMDDEAMEHVYPTPLVGLDAGNVAPQLSTAVTLRTAAERGLASKGRMFLPPTGASARIGEDGRITTGDAGSIAAQVATLCNNLNDAGTGAAMVAGVASSTRDGALRPITNVSAGRVVDTIRSRRNKLSEDPVFLPLG